MSPRDERLARRHIRQRIRVTLVQRRLLAAPREPAPTVATPTRGGSRDGRAESTGQPEGAGGG